MFGFNSSLSLRVKFQVASLLISITAIMIVSIIILSYDQRSGISNFRANLQMIAEIIADRSVAAIEFNDAELAAQNLHAMKAHQFILSGCIYNQYDQVFARYVVPNHILPCPILNEANTDLTQGVMLVEKTIIHSDKKIGTLIISANLTPLRQQAYALLWALAGAVAFATLVSLLLARYLQALITKPIELLSASMSYVTQNKDFTVRAEKKSNDELGDLIDAFNTMLIKIESDNEALKTSEEKFRTLSVSSPIGVFQADQYGEIIYANSQWKQMAGIDNRPEQLNQWVNHIHWQDRELVMAEWGQALLTGDDFKTEYRFAAQNGDNIFVVSHAKALLDSKNKLLGYVGSTLDISNLKSAQYELEKLALYDPLTQLANRFLLLDRLKKSLEMSVRTNTSIALMFLDIDDFKRINDSMGHDAGDELIIVIAERIQSCVRSTDTVARFGGDEFIILINLVNDQSIVDLIAANLLKKIKKPVYVHDMEIVVTASIGITMSPENGDFGGESLMKNADLAMYKAKSKGKDSIQYFSSFMSVEIADNLTFERELRAAVENNEFYLIYQPQFSLRDNTINSYEALLRWNSPKRGLVSPDDIIPTAESTGLIIPIGNWVLNTVCQDIPKLIDSGVLPYDGHIAVNLSVKQLKAQDFVQSIMSILDANDVNPKNIELEITETILMADIVHSVKLLNELKRLGFTLSMDDFGTGYSSLSYLRQLPIDYLKVDKSFIDGLPLDTNDVEITSAILAMSRKLDLPVIAEGVESLEQLSFLRENKCDIAQGYFIGRGGTAQSLIKNANQQLNRALMANLPS